MLTGSATVVDSRGTGPRIGPQSPAGRTAHRAFEGMEQAVRSPRIEFRISRPGSKGPLWPIPQDCRVPARPRAAATVPRGTEFLDAETGG